MKGIYWSITRKIGILTSALMILAGIGNAGTVWTWGQNYNGQLGDSTISARLNPVQVLLLDGMPITGITSVVGGGAHTISLRNDGTVWTWGYNGYGQLGDGTNASLSNPVQVNYSDGTPITNITTIAGGGYYTIVLRNDGTVWTWGINSYGGLGDGSKINRLNPVQVKLADGTPLSGIIAIAGGSVFTVALKNDGTVWTWGYDGNGILGNQICFPICTESPASIPNPVQVILSDGNPLTGITAIAEGDLYIMALKNDGTVWTWGHNGHGELGDGTQNARSNPSEVIYTNGTPLTGVKAIAAGVNHAIALKNDSTVWTWGCNIEGQLGDGDPIIPSSHAQDKSNPVQVIYSDGTPLTDIIAIAGGGGNVPGGSGHSIALKNDSTIWTWGSNSGIGQLGDGTRDDKSNPVQVIYSDGTPLTGILAIAGGGSHTIAIKADNKKNQTIMFGPLTEKIYGDSPFQVNATASSGLSVHFSIKSGPASIDPNTNMVTIIGIGTVTIEAIQVGNDEYNTATPVDQSFDIVKRHITVTADAQTKVYGTVDPILTYNISGMLASNDTFSGSLTRDSGEDAGIYNINQGSLTLNNNYILDYISNKFIINPVYTETILLSSNNPSILNGPVTFIANVVSTNSPATPAGSIEFDDGNNVLETTILSSGTTSFTTILNTVGTIASNSPHTITAKYIPNQTPQNFNPSNNNISQGVIYESSGTCAGNVGHIIRQPINPTSPYSTFKKGSTIPAKIAVCDYNGNSIGTTGVISSFVQTGSYNDSSDINEDIYSTTPDTAFRWDGVSQQWIFNMATNNYISGKYYNFQITFNDGTTTTFKYGIR